MGVTNTQQRFQPYEDYVESSAQWIGKLPKHWKNVALRWLITETNAGEVIDKSYWDCGDEILYSCQRTPIVSSFERFPDDRRVRKGDLLITRNGTPYVHLAEEGAIYTNVVQRIHLDKSIDVVFAWYVLEAAAKSLRGFGDIIESFNMSTWKSLSLPLPELREQLAVVAFLDRETAKIDALIEKKQRLIDLLQEKRTALITHAVTKGLNPEAPMKDSGVEWLVEIPANWDFGPLKRGLIRSDGGVWGADIEPYKNGHTVVLRSTDMTIDGKWDIKDPAIRLLSQVERQNGLLLSGDLLVTKSSGSALHLGKTTIVNDEMEGEGYCFSNFMQRLRFSTEHDSKYYYWIMNSQLGREQLVFLGSSTTGLANLNEKTIGSIFVPFPPFQDQHKIAAFLDCKTAKIDELHEKEEKVVDRLNEFRASLISHAVTGKIDIRGEVA